MHPASKGSSNSPLPSDVTPIFLVVRPLFLFPSRSRFIFDAEAFENYFFFYELDQQVGRHSYESLPCQDSLNQTVVSSPSTVLLR